MEGNVLLFLLHGVPGDRLEGLLYVNGLLGRSLEVGNVALRLAPRLGALLRHHPRALQIDLVTEHDEGEGLGIARTSLNQKFLAPAVKILEGLRHIDVKHKHASIGAAIEGNAQALESLLTSCITMRRGKRWSNPMEEDGSVLRL
jgi:hypothetical protein